MNIYMREALLGGWHLLSSEPTPRPKEVVRVKPVWVGGVGDGLTIRVDDTYCEAYQSFRAAARDSVLAKSCRGESSPAEPAAAAPIHGEFRVGSPLQWI